jgi:putative transposase
LSVRRQCELLGLSRSSLYYEPAAETAENLRLMRLIDEAYTAHPFYGSRKMTAWLVAWGTAVNRKRVQRLLRVMGLEAIYAKPKLSVAGRGHRIYPYLLRGVSIERPDQVWSTDITYLPLAQGFMYLAATRDWYSRYVVSWRLSNTLEGTFCLEMLEEALGRGRPEVFNTDQGAQFTAEAFTGKLLSAGVAVSMDGRGRCLDNVFVERLWRSVKTDPAKTGARSTRCRAGYNNCGDRLPVGVTRTGPLGAGVPHPYRRNRTMSDRTLPLPPRA